jgi:hypothetical protein
MDPKAVSEKLIYYFRPLTFPVSYLGFEPKLPPFLDLDGMRKKARNSE